MDIKEITGSMYPILCLILLILALVVPFIFFNRELKKDRNSTRQEEYNKTKSLLDRGVTSPADIVSYKYLGQNRKLYDGAYEVVVEYEVEIYPDGQPSFRSKFQTWVPKYYSKAEQAKKMWVTYDPSDLTQMEIHHYDFQHEDYLIKKDQMQRRNRFIDAETEAVRVRETGVEALATILEVEDLNVANEEERREGKSMRLKFRVTPNSGVSFESETYVMLALESLPKMVVGRQFYVKYDPQKPEISALIRDANS